MQLPCVNRILGNFTPKTEIQPHSNKFVAFPNRLPKGVVSFLSDMLDAHGLNYAAMVRDKKNYDQWTWKQFRGKIRKFMGIPEQFGPYLKSRNLNKDNLNWIEYETDDEL